MSTIVDNMTMVTVLTEQNCESIADRITNALLSGKSVQINGKAATYMYETGAKAYGSGTLEFLVASERTGGCYPEYVEAGKRIKVSFS